MRWTDISKNVGGKCISNLLRVWCMSFSSLSSVSGPITLYEILLKNEHNFMIGSRTFYGRMPLIAIGNSYVMITWQSCAFIKCMLNFKSFMFARLLMFEQ